MIARQLLPPPLPEDRDDPRVQAAVQTIRSKLGTKECFPDIEPILTAAERRAAKVKGAAAKARCLMEALDDLTGLEKASRAMYGFLSRVGGIDDPQPYDTYLEAVELSRAYLQRRLAYDSDHEAAEDEAPTVLTVAERERGPVPPLKPIMNTGEVAAYLGKSPHTIRHYICDGKIPFHRTGENSFPYFIREEIDTWVAAGNSPSRKPRH
jgi:excisionase family DNA binding protein